MTEEMKPIPPKYKRPAPWDITDKPVKVPSKITHFPEQKVKTKSWFNIILRLIALIRDLFKKLKGGKKRGN